MYSGSAPGVLGRGLRSFVCLLAFRADLGSRLFVYVFVFVVSVGRARARFAPFAESSLRRAVPVLFPLTAVRYL